TKTAGKPIRCRAAVARKAGEPLVIEEVIVAPPRSHEVRIRIICSSLCHSDVTHWRLKAAKGARLCGAARIIGVDVNPDKFNIAKKLGVTDFVNPSNCVDKSIKQVINEMTGGGADYCFECVGLALLMHEAFNSCRKGSGVTVVLGADRSGAQLSLSPVDVMHSGRILTSAVFGGLRAKSDIPILLKRYMDKELQLDEFVTHEVSFEDINKAFDLLISGTCLQCVIWMNK
ncbi:Alcohol dehydrogenase, partial [Bertholletia excelsa]